jgi:hypothetical protein
MRAEYAGILPLELRIDEIADFALECIGGPAYESDGRR